MLQMCFSSYECKLHVRYGCARKNTLVSSLLKVGYNQSLPIQGQGVRITFRCSNDALSPWQGVYSNMSLGIMAQGFKMSRAYYAFSDSFFVKYASLVKAHLKTKAVGNHSAKHLKLYLTHKSNTNIMSFRLVGKSKGRVLLRQHHKLHIGFVSIDVFGENYSIIENGCQACLVCFCKSDSLTHICRTQA